MIIRDAPMPRDREVARAHLDELDRRGAQEYREGPRLVSGRKTTA
jgi:hypothetical protein